MSKIKNIGDYRRVYKCVECKHIQRSHNSGICIKCGNEAKDGIARWIGTTTFFGNIISGRYVGYWEEKK